MNTVARHSTQIDTTELIWDRLFHCRVPQLATTSEVYLKFFGTPTTGDRAIDKELSNQLIDTYINIATMVEHHSTGVAVYVVKRSDTKIIYDYIDQHLRAWTKVLERGINVGTAPIDDLIAMDNFANSVYTVAQHEMKEGEEISPFIRYLNSMGGPMTRPVFADPRMKEVKSDTDDVSVARDSFSEIFKNQRIGPRKWR